MLMVSLAGLWLVGAAPGQTGGLFPPEKLARIQDGIREIYNMEYARAAGRFQGMIRESPDDPAGYVYLAMTYWVQELSGKQELSIDRFAASDFFTEAPKYRPAVDPELEKNFRQVSQQALDKAQAQLRKYPNDRTALFLRGLAYQNLASFETSLKRNWWEAFLLGNKTYRDHSGLLKRDPEFHDAQLSVGVYEYVAGSLPWHIKWLAFLIGKNGDKERGKRQLLTAAQKATIVADDARIILVLIYTREKNFARALDLLEELRSKYPHNYLIPLDMGGISLLMKQPDRAIGIYRGILERRDAGEQDFADLERAALYNRLGVAFRHKRDLAASAEWFRKALAETPLSDRSRTVASLELGKSLDLTGRREEATASYRAVIAAPDIAGSRLEAQRLLKSPFRE